VIGVLIISFSIMCILGFISACSRNDVYKINPTSKCSEDKLLECA